MSEAAEEPTQGSLLDGRVRHDQFRAGHRTGLEPVLLAASVPARPGERVLEGGTGSGAALLCLAARIAGVQGVGIERDAALAALARRNFAANGFAALSVLTGNLVTVRPEGAFDHAFANPPWHDGAATPSPDPARMLARRAEPGLFALWAASLARPLRPRGTLSLIVGAGSLPAALAALQSAGCGGLELLPLWPKPQTPAKILLLRGVKGGQGPCRLHAGLTLHEPDGSFTPAASAILRQGAALSYGR
jgi:tRNA1(Val) A37 N6-methylase TrmN6